MSAIDVILFCSLVPICYEEKGKAFLQNDLPALLNYLTGLMEEEPFKVSKLFKNSYR